MFRSAQKSHVSHSQAVKILFNPILSYFLQQCPIFLKKCPICPIFSGIFILFRIFRVEVKSLIRLLSLSVYMMNENW